MFKLGRRTALAAGLATLVLFNAALFLMPDGWLETIRETALDIVLDVDQRLFGEHAQLTDQVAQLPDMTGPRMAAEPADRGRRKLDATMSRRRKTDHAFAKAQQVVSRISSRADREHWLIPAKDS